MENPAVLENPVILDDLAVVENFPAITEYVPATVPTPSASIDSVSKHLIPLIKQLILEQHYDGVTLLFTSESEAPRNLIAIKEVATDLLHEVCLVHLTDANYEENMALYNCVEELFKTIASHGPAEELLLELLELVEEQKSDNIFTSGLKALQLVLLRLIEAKPRSLEWTLNAVHTRVAELPVPAYLHEGYDLKQQKLLEQEEEVQRLLMNYITVGLFYEPLLAKLIKLSHGPEMIFRSSSIDSRNVLCCFLVQLLGKPLALLDLNTNIEQTKDTNTYTAQCARNITKAITECIVDPFYFLALVEQRVRWKPRLDMSQDVYETNLQNIFLIEEKLPLLSLAIYYYMLLVEEVTLERAPKVYAPLYIFETGMYLATELLGQEEPALLYRGLLLAKCLLAQMQGQEVPAVQLELEIHRTFCHALCNVVGYAPQKHLRQQGVQLLRLYILQFDDEGKYLIIQNLLRSVGHTGICGYLAVIYKDLVANALLLPSSGSNSLPAFYSGANFRSIFQQNICCLPNGATTDLIDNSDRVIASLNALRFFALKDLDNRTGFWDFIADVEKNFLHPLRYGLELSMGHYKAELQRVEKGLDVAKTSSEIDAERMRLQMLDINIANDKSKSSKINWELDRKQKLVILNQNICALELMRSLWARAMECVEKSQRNKKSKK